ncbi:MAG: sensor histidine kinase [Calditrichia bacterium]|nr:sensor histidine kinase [Calditrichia bacterium]
MAESKNKNIIWWTIIIAMIVMISVLHYTTSTMKWQYHLIYMQSYFIPILVAAFQFGVRGGILSAVLVSILYLPHIMLQWGGLVETNMMRFLQIFLFYVIGYLTGFKAQREMEGKKRFQETASELERHLQILNEQTEQLSDLEGQLRQYDRLSVIGELTASLAHEVRNPLGSIRGAVEIMQDEIPDTMRKSDFFRILIEETQRLNTVVEKYLQYARRQSPEIKNFDIRETIQSTRILLSRQFGRSGHELNLHLPDKPCMTSGDPNQLWQILINLLLNAHQAMPEQGEILVNLSVIEANNIAEKEKQEPNNNIWYRISITDHGVGLTAEQMEKIFQPFFSSKSAGTGLGLAIVKRIVEENKWQMEIESKPEERTTFHLILPGEHKS